MRQTAIILYTINELPESAQKKAYYEWLESCEYVWEKENKETLNEFESIFPVKIRHWEYGGRGQRIEWNFTDDEDIEDLSGIRLMKYLWNNYKEFLFVGKYIGHLNRDFPVKHKRIKPRKLNNGRFFLPYHSAVLLSNDCPLTGYCMDYDILKPIYDFLEKPDDNTNFHELMNECLENWLRACAKDLEYCTSFEHFVEESEANEWEYTEYGDLFL
jgi:hypothetical protein